MWKRVLFSMAGSLVWLPTPLGRQAPKLAEGQFVQALSVACELSVAGAVVGVAGRHPAVTAWVDRVVGTELDTGRHGDVSPSVARAEAALVTQSHFHAGLADLDQLLGCVVGDRCEAAEETCAPETAQAQAVARYMAEVKQGLLRQIFLLRSE